MTTISYNTFSIFTATLEAISTGNQRTHHTMVTRDQLNVKYVSLVLKIDFCHLLKTGYCETGVEGGKVFQIGKFQGSGFLWHVNG
jgi:hypothetical protein